jgi:hypothetical protein
MAQKMKAECDEVRGFWTSKAIEEITVCQEGCCGIAEGVKAEVLQQKECEELAISLGYTKDDIEFDTGITRQDECFKKYATQDRGCCVLGGGQCEYGIRESCTTLGGNFIPLAGNKFCRDVTQCAATSHSYYSCGLLPGTEFDIYWYDSQGSQEEIKEDCDYPEGLCTEEETGEVYCKSTTCRVQGTAQKIIDYYRDENGYLRILSGHHPPLVREAEINEILLTGQSTCYNFYTHYGLEENNLYERSTGLQNQILHCRLGDIEIEGLGPDREKLCVLGEQGMPTQHATVKENEWENCTACGGGGFIGVGDLFGPFPPLGRTLAATLGHYCTPESCNEYGDCVYHEDYPSFWWGMSTPIGSCDPMYPPGTVLSCSECGRGGDGLWNICDESECMSLGDCSFTPASGWEKFGLGVMLSLVSVYMHRVNLIPAEFIMCSACTIGTFGQLCQCDPFALVSDRVNRYVKGPLGPFTGMLTFADWGKKTWIEKSLSLIGSAAGVITVVTTIMNFFKK